MTSKAKPKVIKLADVLRDPESQKLLGETVFGIIREQYELYSTSINQHIEERIQKWASETKIAPVVCEDCRRPSSHWGILIAILVLLGGLWFAQARIVALQREVAAIHRTDVTLTVPFGDLTTAITLAAERQTWSPKQTVDMSHELKVVNPGKPCWVRIVHGKVQWEGMLAENAVQIVDQAGAAEVRDGCPGQLYYELNGSRIESPVNLSHKPAQSEVTDWTL